MAKLKIRVYLFLVRAVLRLLAEIRPKGFREVGAAIITALEEELKNAH